MKGIFKRIAFILSLVLTIGLIATPVSADGEDYSDFDRPYSDKELLNMSVEQLDKLGLREAVEDFKNQERNTDVSLSSITHRPGDILVTKSTQCKTGVKCTGLTGHSGIVIQNGYVVHIEGPGQKAKQITVQKWLADYKSTKVVRPNNATQGRQAATWALNYYIHGKGANYEYDVRTTLNGTGRTYCSKLVWQAYSNGAGKNLFGGTPGIRTPYDFINFTILNGHKVVHTVNW